MTPGAPAPEVIPSSQVKALLGGGACELDSKEWVVANADGRILCTRLADIAWVRAVEGGVELRIGVQTFPLRDTFESWVAKLPAEQFARRGDSLLLNIKRLQPLRAALASAFQRRSTAWVAPSRSGTSPRRGRR